MVTETMRDTLADVGAEVGADVATCETCGAVSAPDGRCIEVGACLAADVAATRGATVGRAKFAVPAAWNARGRVD